MENIPEPNYEYVILIDKNNNAVGTAKKSEIHQKQTPLHRAFSAFIFNEKKELLLQQRAHHKKTWPLVWSNSVCGHPKLNETYENAAKRRSKDELGCEIKNVKMLEPYQYKASRDGVQENEICPIVVGQINSNLNLNPQEVENTKWITWENWLKKISKPNNTYSIWCIEETQILNKSKKFKQWLNSI